MAFVYISFAANSLALIWTTLVILCNVDLSLNLNFRTGDFVIRRPIKADQGENRTNLFNSIEIRRNLSSAAKNNFPAETGLSLLLGKLRSGSIMGTAITVAPPKRANCTSSSPNELNSNNFFVEEPREQAKLATKSTMQTHSTYGRDFRTASNGSEFFTDSSNKLRRVLPQAIIIGVKKGGTRALLEFLRVHPDVRAAGPETHFFDKNYARGFDWYRQQMPQSTGGQITIEKTPSYFITDLAPERIYRMSNQTKLIVVLRDPVTRAISHYTQALSKRPRLPPFEKLAFRNVTNATMNHAHSVGGATVVEEVNPFWGATKIGLYAEHLLKWTRFFPPQQILVVDGERLIADPANEVRGVEEFLNLRSFITKEHFVFSKSKGFPCLRRTLDSTSSPRVHVHCLGKNKGRSHPPLGPDVVQRLRDYFRPYNEALFDMIERRFEWPYKSDPKTNLSIDLRLPH